MMAIQNQTKYEELRHWLASSLSAIRTNPEDQKIFEGRPSDITKRDCEKLISKLEKESSTAIDKLNRIRSSRQSLFKEIDRLTGSFRIFYYALLYYLLLKSLYRSKAKSLLKKLIAKSTDREAVRTLAKELKALFRRSSVKLQEKKLRRRLKRVESDLLKTIQEMIRGPNLKKTPITLTELIRLIDQTYEKCGHDEVRFGTEILKAEDDILKSRYYSGSIRHRPKDTILTSLIVYLVDSFLHLPGGRSKKTKSKAYRLATATFNYCFFPEEEQTEEHIRLRYDHHWGRKHKPNK